MLFNLRLIFPRLLQKPSASRAAGSTTDTTDSSSDSTTGGIIISEREFYDRLSSQNFLLTGDQLWESGWKFFSFCHYFFCDLS
jgi:hypothetical protein